MVGSASPKPGGCRDDGSQDHLISRRALLQAAVLGAATIPGVASAAQQATPVPPPVETPVVLPAASSETWQEPWIWRPGDWPGQQLNLNVQENENPGAIVGYGNQSAVLFSYNGSTPGPTIRMAGDETLLVRLRNLLGQNMGSTYFGPYPDPNALPSGLTVDQVNAKAEKLGNFRVDYCLGEHTNGVHSNHDTNLHAHGLHVRPGRNPDGTHSDNVILRLIDPGDLEKREEQAESPMCAWLRDPEQTDYLRDDETTGFADFEFRLGDVQAELRRRQGLGPQPHPPGTHWYHPHCHGATHNQVASGMAGFLIIEGDVDEAINRELTGHVHPDPQLRTGDYDYLERLMLIQRVFVGSTDPDATTQHLKGGGNASPLVNGNQTPMIITMRPGAIERWRILNGSVDGKGFTRFMVLKGQYDVEESMSAGGGMIATLVKLRDASKNEFTPATRAEVSADKQHMYQLAFDGVTLIDSTGDKATYTIRNLAEQNAGTENPLDRKLEGKPNQAMLANYQACFVDAESVRNTFIRPNEVYLAPANRADIIFQAPPLSNGDAKEARPDIYTVVARAVIVHNDDYQNALQSNYTKNMLAPSPEDIVVAYIIVDEGVDSSGKPLPPIPGYDVMDLVSVLPPVPEYLQPITDEDVRIKTASGDADADPDAAIAGRAGMYRTRTITYSGWGAGDFPLVTTEGTSETAKNFKAFVEQDQKTGGELELLRYAAIGDSGEYMLLAPNIRSMAISNSTSTEIVDDSDPLFPVAGDMARKFDPDDPTRPQILENSAEEWALYNYSISLWADTAKTPLGAGNGHLPGLPLLRAEGQAKFDTQPVNGWMLQTKSVDHPFHMHQNPYWVMRIEVPDERGNLVNILDAPRWQDVVFIPRNGGRVVFRSRFPDFVSTYVNHCHILLHEDDGMMQVVQVSPYADQANYDLKDRVASKDASADDVTAIYPRFDQARAWRQSLMFFDGNHGTGQKFPGFVPVDPPPVGD